MKHSIPELRRDLSRLKAVGFSLMCMSVALAGREVRAAQPEVAGTQARPVPVQILLEAQGNLEAGCLEAGTLSAAFRPGLAGEVDKAKDRIARIYPACRAVLSATVEDRVCASMEDAFRGDLVVVVCPDRPARDVDLAPVYPAGVKAPEYGRIPMIVDDPSLWATPGYWGAKLEAPLFAGWQIEPGAATLSKNCSALVRSDFRIGDAEMSGEVRVDEGESVFVILRSDIVIKFQTGKAQSRGGNLTVKFGYDNLRTSSLYAQVPEIVPGAWYQFRVIVGGGRLHVFFDGKEALDTAIASDPRTSRKTQGQAGYFGFGCNGCSGAFREVYLSALSPAGKHLLPRFTPQARYGDDGAPVRMLDGKEEDFIALVHNKTERYDKARHPITNGVLQLKGAPYVQLARKNTEWNHFKITGRMRFMEEGSVWLRANSGLVFGIRCIQSESPFAVKHSTGNFNYADEEAPGQVPALENWYSWEIEYHDPVGILRFDGKTALVSQARAGREGGEAGLNQFGIGSYNTRVEVADVVMQKLAQGGPGGKAEADRAAAFFKKGFEGVEKAVAALKSDAGADAPTVSADGRKAAQDILEGRCAALAASGGEVVKFAEGFRDRRDWPTYLALLEANCGRFAAGSEAGQDAQGAWESAKASYETALKSVKVGEIGLDNILRVGAKPGPMFAAGDGHSVWVSVPDTGELLKYDCWSGTVTGHVALKVTPRMVVARGDYFLCASGGRGGRGTNESARICKISLADGAVLAETNAPGGMLMDMVGHPKKAVTYFSVDMNPDDERVFKLGLCRIWILNEDTMQITESDAAGMFLCADPLGRYLYAGFHVEWSPRLALDAGFFHVLPYKGHIDHVVRYAMTGAGLACDGERPAPGVDGFRIAADPAGRTVCYVAASGGIDLDGKEREPFAIRALKSTALGITAGVYDAGNEPQCMEFNPARPEAYVLTGGRIRRYDTVTRELKGEMPLPSSVAKFPVQQLLSTPDGSGLMAAYVGKPAGVYIQRLGMASNEPAQRQRAGMDAGKSIEEAGALISAGRATEGARLLRETALSFSFTEAGEKAAARLFELDGAPYAASAAIFQIAESPTNDLEKAPVLEGLVIPAAGPGAMDRKDPRYGGSNDFEECVDTLMSLAPQADTHPFSWLMQARESEEKFPGSQLLKLETAVRLKKMGRLGAASNIAREVIESVGRSAWYGARAYSLLAGIYRQQNDQRREVSALMEATALCPRDASLHARLGAAFDAIGLTNRAAYHKLVSWRLFPSADGLEKALAGAGIVPEPTRAPMDTASLFREASPAVVLISHPGGNGTGFIVGRNGLLLTNRHVIEGADGKLKVKLKDIDGIEHSFDAVVLASDAVRDVALLSIEPGDLKLKPLVLGDSDAVKTGDRIVAIGNPAFGSEVLTQTATDGIISGKNRMIGGCEFLQVSAAVNPGNSGGPLLNERGEVVGMVTLRAQLENVGFAAPSRDLLAFINKQETE